MEPVEKKLKDLKSDPNQGERSISDDYLESLGQSMLAKGQLHPLHIMPDGLIITGERRWLAAKRVGIKSLDCYIRNDLTQYKSEKLASELRAIRISENRQRGSESGVVEMSPYYAHEFKAQQEYYRSLSDKELLEEIGLLYFCKNEARSKYDRETPEGVMKKAKPTLYNLIARKLDILDAKGKPRADTVRKNIMLIDGVPQEVKDVIEKEKELPKKDRKVKMSHLEETFKDKGIDTPEQKKQIKNVQKEIAKGGHKTSRDVRTIVKAIQAKKSERVIEKVKEVVKEGEPTFKKKDQDSIIKYAEEEVASEGGKQKKKKGGKKEFDEFLQEVESLSNKLMGKVALWKQQIEEVPGTAFHQSSQLADAVRSLVLLISTFETLFRVRGIKEERRKITDGKK